VSRPPPTPATPPGSTEPEHLAATGLEPCTGNNGLLNAQQCYSQYYAGGAVRAPAGTSFTNVEAGWNQAAFKNSDACGTGGAYLTSAGLGGFNGKLMQAGTLNENALLPNPPYAPYNAYQYSKVFWEVVNNQTSVSPLFVFTYDNGSKANPGGYVGLVNGGTLGGTPDYVQAYVAYYNETPQTASKGEFLVADVTQGWDLSTGYFNQVTTGQTLPQTMYYYYYYYYYYYGSTADFITDREQAGDASPYLREPFKETTDFDYASANSTSIDPSNYPGWTQITEPGSTGEGGVVGGS
jgi:hypothetical protein